MTRNQVCLLISIPLAVLATFYFLTSVALLIFVIIFGVAAGIAAYQRQPFILPLSVSVIAAAIFITAFFVPVWLASASAKTPDDHRRLAELYATRGQLFGSPTETIRHLTIAAEGGDSTAASRLGEAYLFGHYRVKTDRSLARHWLERASLAGVSSASQLLRDAELTQ